MYVNMSQVVDPVGLAAGCLLFYIEIRGPCPPFSDSQTGHVANRKHLQPKMYDHGHGLRWSSGSSPSLGRLA